MDGIGPGDRTDFLTHVAAQFGHQGIIASAAGLQGHKGHDALPLELIGTAHHGRLGHGAVAHQGRFDFHRAQPVARHIDDVINPAHHPEVAIGVAAGPIAGKIEPAAIGGANFFPVALAEALGIAMDRAHHPRPGTAHGQVAPLIRPLGVAFVVHHIGGNARQGQGG